MKFFNFLLNSKKRIEVNSKYISRITSDIIGFIYGIIGYVSLFVPLNEVLPDEYNIWNKILISTIILIILWFLCFLIVSFFTIRKKRNEIVSINNGFKIYIQYGDLFSENEVINSLKRRNIVIPVNRCFDTIVDDNIISTQTLHGKLFKKLYDQNVYTEESLNNLIQQQLINKKFEQIDENEKSAGNRKRYEIGTIVKVNATEREQYWLWGLSSFKNGLTAQTTMEEYCCAVQKLIEACDNKSDGFPVVIPLVGAGLSRTNRSQEDIIQYLISAFKLNKDKLNSDIHIIVKEELKNKISIFNIN